MCLLTFGIAEWWPLELVALLFVGGTFAGAGLFLSSRQSSRRETHRGPRSLEPTPAPPAEAKAAPPTASAANHRDGIRTSGTWVKVVLADDSAGGRLLEGHVIDYTSNGVGIVLFEALPVGKVLKARHAKAPGDVPWVRLEVRSCQQLEKTIWKAGCQVDDITLWDTLLRYS